MAEIDHLLVPGEQARYPKKRYAQYWLRDQGVLTQIVQVAALTKEDTVLEIGPGTGNLTELLLKAAGRVEAIEIDRTLAAPLAKRFQNRPFTVHFGDVLAEPLPPLPTVVVANIPYYITGLILEKLLGSPHAPITQFRRVVLLVQREIAERLAASPGGGAYGSMSVHIQYLAQVELVAVVGPRAFYPRPKVDSAIVALTPRPFVPAAENPVLLERLVRQGFSMRRKMLRNTLKPLAPPTYIEQLLTNLGERLDSRAEALSVTQWVHFANGWRPPQPLREQPFPK
ncbi:16S rRNA (adenine(1518)-N(6)/adenine(1519)-N(6))-dimethyltransferase RsmA [Anthocerotibacter panamensis]|uniref:16S rRNA (adenine(1518)-N(6)/adenine(1519)-N(6))- dimethyltransferase RsmA n=1 Tax=Anthocerotibacter panamensis TaxID=2857077 RepID=UPI001C403E56|nr:16S rRNA (adenine(1518)-N(6)/adenine(1519)-N(6))-dimethyltransferase RsmA [Anthocerotibacter panamensis]